MDPSNKKSLRKAVLKKRASEAQGPSKKLMEAQLVKPLFAVAPEPVGVLLFSQRFHLLLHWESPGVGVRSWSFFLYPPIIDH